MTLTNLEIEKVAKNISNFWYTENLIATKELIELFDKIARKPISTPEEYVKMYDYSFYTYKTFKELVESEEEQSDGLTEDECKEELNKSIWQLPCGWFVQKVL